MWDFTFPLVQTYEHIELVVSVDVEKRLYDVHLSAGGCAEHNRLHTGLGTLFLFMSLQ